MLYIHWNPDPTLIDLGFIALRWYSVLFALGIFLGYLQIKKRFTAEGIPAPTLDKFMIYLIAGIVIGARLGHCLFYDFAYYSQHPLEMILPFRFSPEFEFTGFQGLASHGGAIGILTAMWMFCRKYKISGWYVLDVLGFSIPLTGIFIRLGNLMNSEIVGSESDVPWAFIFKRLDNVPRHPGQLYEAIAYGSIFLIMLWLRKRGLKFGSGRFFGYFLVITFSARFLIEFLKENQKAFEDSMQLNMGQWLSVPFVIVGIYLLATRKAIEQNKIN